MKLQVLINATVYKVKANVMKDRQTGQEINWYQVVLDQNEDVETFTCSEDVYVNARRGQECTLIGEYDSQNKRFKITGIVQGEPQKPEVPEAPAVAPADVPTDAPEAPVETPAEIPVSETPTETTDDQPAKKGKRS